MKKGTEILKEVYFTNDPHHPTMSYSDSYKYMQILINWDKREIQTYMQSNWNSSYNVNNVVKF